MEYPVLLISVSFHFISKNAPQFYTSQGWIQDFCKEGGGAQGGGIGEQPRDVQISSKGGRGPGAPPWIRHWGFLFQRFISLNME